jgi:hypothetical protein
MNFFDRRVKSFHPSRLTRPLSQRRRPGSIPSGRVNVAAANLALIVSPTALVQIVETAMQCGIRHYRWDQAASAALQISGAAFPAAPILLSANWPFLMRCTSSTPAMVIAAFRNRLSPSIGPKRSLMDL